eukprot:13497098-Ditylum_brightwellii.AAC.1
MISVYGDTIHGNDGSHLSGGIVDDKLWQKFWTDLTALPSHRYDVPSGSVGRRFLFALVGILDSVVERRRMEHQMDLWEKGEYTALVEDTIK